MSITLNSPKYADTRSLAYQMHKKQQDRKARKNPFTPQLFERFFRRNEGTTDYATIPTVTLSGDFVIEFEFLISGNSGIATIIGGSTFALSEVVVDITATGVVRLVAYNSSGTFVGVAQTGDGFNDGLLHKCRARLSGATGYISVDNASEFSANFSLYDTANIANLYRRVSGGNIFSGILANLRIYAAGTLVRDYPIDDNSTDLREKVSGQNGTLINGTAGQWALYQQQRTLEWLGPELSLITSTDILGDNSDPEFSSTVFDSASGREYRVSAMFSSYVGTIEAGWSAATGIPNTTPFRIVNAIAGDVIGGDYVATSTASVVLFGRAAALSSYDNISSKEVLNVA